MFTIIFVLAHKRIGIAGHNIQNLLNFIPVKGMTGFDSYGVQPNLGYTNAIPGDMAMSWFTFAIAFPLVNLTL